MTQPQVQQVNAPTPVDARKRYLQNHRIEEEFDAVAVNELGIDYNDDDGHLHED